MAVTSAESLRHLVALLLEAGGAEAREAQIVADVWCWADERERHPQGAIWIEPFLARLAAGTLVSPASLTVRHSSPAAAHVDAGHGFGPVAGRAAVDLVTVKAREVGVGVVTVVNSTHFGAAGHYAARIADQGLLGVACTNAYPKVAAHGGTRPALGTNPIAFSVPVAGNDAVIGDLSTGALAGSRVREAIEAGEPLPDGTALDASGNPTTDPGALDRGGVMLPAAGPKGFALGLMVELLTSVLGAGAIAAETGSMFEPTEWVGVSHTFLALAPLDDAFASRAAALLTQVEEADPSAVVRIPGRDRERAAARARAEGIELPRGTVNALQRSADRLGVTLPPELCVVATP